MPLRVRARAMSVCDSVVSDECVRTARAAAEQREQERRAADGLRPVRDA
jgi:hypothetical protein